ncbi:C4-dicarboxylate ABC transporter [Rhodococcus sp. IEGM 1408]|uniref:SLAC1 family transporter n=1 Tax=Rhodococcus sp. IEGM 1408 TaxID=3082220 RepID=UPI00295307A9|nr:C4-dicarboxylate ABC transporter [Rhodococcus sp. IEGM 1408]MDV8000956.1 C4-dicarboxylate ABC transporter [Rhodococcus sp. IEGM 1408]
MTTSPGADVAPPGHAVPGPGPAWFGAVMGTGILATLLQLHAVHVPAFGAVAPAVLVLAWVLLLGLGAGFARSIARDPAVWTRSIGEASMLPLWGMVSMGLLAVGSGTFTVVDAHAPAFRTAALGVDAALWLVGTVLGLATAAGFTYWLLTRRPAHPLPTWALPLVPPMVTATAGGALAAELDPGPLRTALVAVCAVAFVVALTLGGGVIAVAYRHAWRRTPIPVALATSTWIPLGILGQSTAAAQELAGPQLAAAARWYGVAAMAAGAAAGAFAAATTVRGFRARMPFHPGWWAMTFPLGTCALGAHHLEWWPVSLGILVALCGTWSLCTVASLRAIRASRSAAR